MISFADFISFYSFYYEFMRTQCEYTSHLNLYAGIGNGTISTCMKVPLLNDFAVMLSVYTRLVSSPLIKEKTFQEIKDFFDGRMIYRRHYFENNSGIKNAYQFARKVLDFYSGK